MTYYRNKAYRLYCVVYINIHSLLFIQYCIPGVFRWLHLLFNFGAIDYKNGIRKKKTGERFGKLLRGPGLEDG